MTNQFQPISRGPQKGAPPSLEFVALDRLQVDAAYQRATDGPYSRRIIVGMVKQWDWSLCQPLVVSRRADGSLWILDGQHRHAGAVERGDIAHLPCVVLAAVDAAGEAQAFVELNTKRQRLSQVDIFNGMLAAGEPNASATAALIKDTGWRLTRTQGSGKWKPGDLVCGPMLASAHRVHGAAVLRAALTTLRKAYPDIAVGPAARLLDALIEIYRNPFYSRRDSLVPALASVSPGKWLVTGEKCQHSAGVSRRTGLATVIYDTAVNFGRAPAGGGGAELKQAPAALEESKFGSSGKGWCEQCQELVSQGRAAGCKDQFCKMKLAA